MEWFVMYINWHNERISEYKTSYVADMVLLQHSNDIKGSGLVYEVKNIYDQFIEISKSFIIFQYYIKMLRKQRSARKIEKSAQLTWRKDARAQNSSSEYRTQSLILIFRAFVLLIAPIYYNIVNKYIYIYIIIYIYILSITYPL